MSFVDRLTSPVVFEISRVLPGPPDVVWELVSDWEHQGDWMLEASDFVVLSSHREGVGVEAEATIRIGGLKSRDRVRVTVWEPHRRLAIEHLGWVKGVGDIRLSPADGHATHMRWTESLLPPMGALGGLGLRAFRPLMRRIFERDIRVLEGLVRARSR